MTTTAPKILISFPFVEDNGNWSNPLGATCVKAFKDFGFEVAQFNPVTTSRTGFGLKTLERLAVAGGRLIGQSKADTKSRLPWLQDARRFNQLYQLALQERPDYCLVISTFTYPRRITESLRRDCGIRKMIGWCVEGPTWIGNPNNEAELYDHYFCIHRINITRPDIQYLPAIGFDPAHYSRLPDRTKSHEIVFVGHEKKRRVEWLSPLLKEGLEIYGPSWEHTPLASVVKSCGIFGSDLNRLYNESKIVINVSSWPNEKASCLNLRILDVPATGSMLLTDYAPGIEEILVPDKEVVLAHSPEEMHDKARYYLAHEAERERIALAGWERVSTFETYPQKMHRLLDACGIAMPA